MLFCEKANWFSCQIHPVAQTHVPSSAQEHLQRAITVSDPYATQPYHEKA